MSANAAKIHPAGVPAGAWQDGPLKVVPAASPGRGRGLFAAATIAGGEVIERACSIPLTSKQCDRLESILPLGDYYFRHPEDPEKGLLLLGLVSLVNHSEDPNTDVRFVHCEELGWIAELVSRHPIAIGEEITYCYRCGPWFKVG